MLDNKTNPLEEIIDEIKYIIMDAQDDHEGKIVTRIIDAMTEALMKKSCKVIVRYTDDKEDANEKQS